VLGEEPGAELERGLVLARVNGVPDRPHPALRDAAGEPELASHAFSQSRVRVLRGVGSGAPRVGKTKRKRKRKNGGGAEAGERGFIESGM
jgi:hypothetical protein